MQTTLKNIYEILQEYREILVLTLTGVLIGLVTGLIEAFFGVGLNMIVDFHERIGNILLLGLPLGGLFTVYLFTHYGRPALPGMSLLFEVDQNKLEKIPKRTTVCMIVSTWITHLFGGSAGKEGVAVQVGGTVSNALARWMHMKEARSIFIVVGIAAGFAGLFQTPFTAVFFAMEVLAAGLIRYAALPPALTAAFTASLVSSFFGLKKASQLVEYTFTLTSGLVIKLVLLGILFGILGQFFAAGLHFTKIWIKEHFTNPYKRILVLTPVLVAVLLFWGWGRYSSVSADLLNACFHQEQVYWYDWLGKFVCTVLTIAIGFQGGEVTPLYTMGACLGCIMGPMMGLSGAVGAMLGYAAVFGAGTNTYLASIMIGMEIFGYQYFPLFFICCSVAYLVNRNQSIYAMQQIFNR